MRRLFVVAALGVVLGGCTVEVQDSTPPTTVEVTTTTEAELSQAETERLFVAWVEYEYGDRWVGDKVLKAVKYVCDGLANGETVEDIVLAVMGAGLTQSQQMEMAQMLGEGVRAICPDWAWKLETTN